MTTKPPHFVVSNLLRARDWQDRVEFQRLCQWWSNGGRGVCALIGIGGAGKTAIIDRFLAKLGGIYFNDEENSQGSLTPTPDSVFVFPFYEFPTADTFFNLFTGWLAGTTLSNEQLQYSKTLQLVVQNRFRILLVLDGMEMVQDDGTRGGLVGQILDKSLRSFLLAIARGTFPQISVVVTSRFPVNDLNLSKNSSYLPVRVDKLSRNIAVNLLRARGVTSGTFQDLDDLARGQGYHALTVDLMGGFIGRYCDGNPLKLPPDPIHEIRDVAQSDAIVDVDAKSLLDQQIRLARLAKRYQHALSERDPAALALLERVCLFRLGIDAKTLVAVFTGENKENISGQALASLSEQEFQAKLALLCEMRLIEKTSYGIYTAHPAIREGFLQGVEGSDSSINRESVRQGLEILLGSRPGDSVPSEPRNLDILEEIVYQTIASKKLDEAWSIYMTRLGGYSNLGCRLANFERGERICKEFVGRHSPVHATEPAGLSAANCSVLFNEWGLHLSHLGKFADAEACFNKAVQLERSSSGKTISLLNLAEIQILQGRLSKGAATIKLAVHESIGSSLNTICLALEKHVESLLGQRPYGVHAIRAFLYYDLGNQTTLPSKLRGCLVTPHLSERNLSRFDVYLAKGFAIKPSSHRSAAIASLVSAELAIAQANIEEAKKHLALAHNRAVDIDSPELLCWSEILGVKLILKTMESSSLDSMERKTLLCQAFLTAHESLNRARKHGLSTMHIDILLIRAQIYLLVSDSPSALRDIHTALYGLSPTDDPSRIYESEPLTESSIPEARGIFPSPISGFPVLVAAKHFDCHYSRGVKLAQELLEQINTDSFRTVFGPEFEFESLPPSEIQPPSETPPMNTPPDDIQPPYVLISYTHDSTEHDARVLQLATRLRKDGVLAMIDRYISNPPAGWPLWMHAEIEKSKFVLVISTQQYASKALADKRSGGRFESVLVLQEIYEAGMSNDRFIPIVFDENDKTHILSWLRPVNCYNVSQEAGYEALLRRLLDDPEYIPPPVGKPNRKGPKPLH